MSTSTISNFIDSTISAEGERIGRGDLVSFDSDLTGADNVIGLVDAVIARPGDVLVAVRHANGRIENVWTDEVTLLQSADASCNTAAARYVVDVNRNNNSLRNVRDAHENVTIAHGIAPREAVLHALWTQDRYERDGF